MRQIDLEKDISSGLQDLQPAEGYRLPAEAYTSQAWFDFEQRRLFERSWVFAGWAGDLRQKGSFNTLDVGRAPVLILRDQDGGLAGFHNLCRHRGCKLVEGQGQLKKLIVCPYHRWVYELNGRLRGIPQKSSQFPEVVEADWGLKPVAIEVWAGMIFVNVAADPVSFEDFIGEMGTWFGHFECETLEESLAFSLTVDGNWKFFVENHIDWLHLYHLHAHSLKDWDHDGGERHQKGAHWSSYEPLLPGQNTDLLAIDDIPGLEEREKGVGAHFVFPNLPLISNGFFFGSVQLVPRSPRTTDLNVSLRTHGGASLTDLNESLQEIFAEDKHAIELLQQAVQSPAFEVGPMALEYEASIATFHHHYLEALK